MSLTPVEIALSQLNQELTQIITRYIDNDTSYFPHIEKVLDAFENYLETLGPKEPHKKQFFFRDLGHLIFEEKVKMQSLNKWQKFIHLVINWGFGFNDDFMSIINSRQIKPSNKEEPFLPEVSVKQIIFLMYLGLEVERKEICGKGIKHDEKRTFVLKEIVHILEEFFHNSDDQSQDPLARLSFSNYSINEEKLLKVIQLRTVKLRLEKENFSFSFQPSFKSANISPKNGSRSIDECIDSLLKKKADENGSLVSVKSEFEESQHFEEKAGKLREVEKKGFGRKEITSEEIFKSISLRK